MRIPLGIAETENLKRISKVLGDISGKLQITTYNDHVKLWMLDSSRIMYIEYVIDENGLMSGYEKSDKTIEVDSEDFAQAFSLIKPGPAIYTDIEYQDSMLTIKFFIEEKYWRGVKNFKKKIVQIPASTSEEEIFDIKLDYTAKYNVLLKDLKDLRLRKDYYDYYVDLKIKANDSIMVFDIYKEDIDVKKTLLRTEINVERLEGENVEVLVGYEYFRKALDLFTANRDYDITLGFTREGPLELKSHNMKVLIAPRIE